MLAHPHFLWTGIALAMPFIIATHLGAIVLSGAYGTRAGEPIALVVAGLTAGVLLFFMNYVARVIGVVLPYSVIAIGAGSTIVGMSVARVVTRSHAPG